MTASVCPPVQWRVVWRSSEPPFEDVSADLLDAICDADLQGRWPTRDLVVLEVLS